MMNRIIPMTTDAVSHPHVTREFLALGAPHEINIDAKTMDYTVQRLKNPDRYVLKPCLLNESPQGHLYMLEWTW